MASSIGKWTKRSSRAQLLRIAMGSAFLVGGVSSSYADELKVMDTNGKVRSMAELADGTSAMLRVKLTPQSAESSITVSLLNSVTDQVIQEATADAAGLAVFQDVKAGNFKIALPDSASNVSVADVEVVRNTMKKQSKADSANSKRESARAMYVAGASAVAGGVAIALGSSSDGSGSASSSAFVETDLSGVREAGGSVLEVGGNSNGSGPAALAADNPPSIPTPDPAPGSITPVTPPSNNVGGSAGGTTSGSGDNTPTPPPPTPSPTISN
ncbi:MAG: hypothetical protein KDD44_06875 [Bdellovibrionales bacterium]|nr:hypothetical protein [Bdellovibrionales bacterium]